MIETFPDKDKVLVQYLFNELDEAQMREFEDEMLLDNELFERVQVVEMNLIDGYVRKEMTAEESRRFEENFLAVAENKDKVKRAYMFHDSLRLQREKEQVESLTIRGQGRFRLGSGLFQRPLPALAFSIVALLLTVALIAMLINQRHADNTNIIVANSAPTISDNANLATNAESNSSKEITASVPQQKPLVTPSPNKAPNNSGIEISKNYANKYSQRACLYCQGQRSGERSGGDAVPIILGKKVTRLSLMHELLNDVRERETYGVTIKDRYNVPIKLNNRDKEEVRPVRIKGRKFIIINVPTSVFKDSGPYSFEIDEPNLSPKIFTIKK